MGFPPRLDGKLAPLPSDETETCPNCGRKFPVYHVVSKAKQSIRECPYCDYEFKVKPEKKHMKAENRGG